MRLTTDLKMLAEQSAEIERLAHEGIAHVPSAVTIAAYVRLQRAFVGWKQQALAFLADVSLSTIERIERGETVSTESLDRVAEALHLPPGAFTHPRVPLGAEQAASALAESLAIYEESVSVAVRPLRGQRQVAALAQAHFLLFDANRIGPGFEGEIDNLREWLDLVGFILATEDKAAFITTDRREHIQRRQLYADVLKQVAVVERVAGAVILAGTYEAKTGLAGMPTATVALVAVLSTRADPAALKRRTLWAPAKFDAASAWDEFCAAGDG